MKLKIMDWEGKKTKTKVDLEKLEKVKMMVVEVVSGDEILHVLYKDGTTEEFDSSTTRQMDFRDGRYILYNPEACINRLQQFMDRNTSYTLL